MRQILLSPLTFSFMLALSVMHHDPAHADSTASADSIDFAVATVGSDTIWRGDFHISDEAYSQIIRMEAAATGGSIDAASWEGDRNIDKRQRECKLLAAKIRATVHKRICLEYQIQVTEQEMAAKRESLWGRDDPDAYVDRVCRTLQLLKRAIEAVYEGDESEDWAYEYYLKDSTEISQRQWNLFLVQGESAKFRSNLREALSKGVVDPIDVDRQVRSLLIDEKLTAIIDRELASTDSVYAVFLDRGRLLQNGDLRESVSYEGQKSAEWWEKKYRQYNVKILDSPHNCDPTELVGGPN